MSQALLSHVAASSLRNNVPAVKPGCSVKVFHKIKEGDKERVQVFQGLVIRVSSGSGVAKTFTVRKVVQGIGVEKIFPFHAATVEKVEVIKQGKVRRSKLYYMRRRQGKSTRLRETDLEIEMIEAPVVGTAAGELVEEVKEETTDATAEPVAESTIEETPAEEPTPEQEEVAEEK